MATSFLCSPPHPPRPLQNLSERKKKSLLERGQAEEEMDELRRSYQEELDQLRQSLKKARTSTGQAASEEVRGRGEEAPAAPESFSRLGGTRLVFPSVSQSPAPPLPSLGILGLDLLDTRLGFAGGWFCWELTCMFFGGGAEAVPHAGGAGVSVGS